jgi:hypothetical protein
MSLSSGRNDGFRVLDEFICDAVPASGMPASSSCGRGKNAGMQVTQELTFQALADGIAPLAALSSAELLALVEGNGAGLTLPEAKTIVQIALERVERNEDPLFAGSKRLLAAAAEAVCRLA